MDVDIDEYSYLWSDGSDLPYIEISGSDIGVGEHIYWVIVTDTNSCSNSDSITVIVIKPSGIEFTDKDNLIKIYPNPTHNFLNVEFCNHDQYNVKIILIDNIGNEIIIEDYHSVTKGEILEIDVSTLYKGFYTINIVGNHIFYSTALIIQ